MASNPQESHCKQQTCIWPTRTHTTTTYTDMNKFQKDANNGETLGATAPRGLSAKAPAGRLLPAEDARGPAAASRLRQTRQLRRSRPRHQQERREVTDEHVDQALNASTEQIDASASYRSRCKEFKVLAHLETVDAAKRYAAARALRHELTIDAHGLALTDERCRTILNEGDAARERLILHNMRLVFHIAQWFPRTGLDFDDLVSFGTIGLIKAIEKYEFTFGYRFSTYAVWWIKQKIRRGIMNTGSLVRLPVHVHDMLRKISKTRVHLEMSGLPSNTKDISHELELPMERYQSLMRTKALRDWLPLDTITPGAYDATLHPGGPQDDWVRRRSIFDVVVSTLMELDPRARAVLALRFGLVDDRKWTLEGIGDLLGLTRERIRQIEKDLVHQLSCHEQMIRIYKLASQSHRQTSQSTDEAS